MSGAHPDTVIDPVCGMTVNVSAAEADGRTITHEGRTYAFCRAGCRRAFEEDPASYIASNARMPAVADGARGLLVIDEGMRRWYESCSCCLSDAYPEIKAALDAERAAQSQETAGPGICEVAEAHEAHDAHDAHEEALTH